MLTFSATVGLAELEEQEAASQGQDSVGRLEGTRVEETLQDMSGEVGKGLGNSCQSHGNWELDLETLRNPK